MLIKVVIVEGDLPQAWQIEQMLEELGGYQVLKICQDADSTLLFLRENMPDFILINVKLNGELNGVDLAHRIASYSLPIIFISQYQDSQTYRDVQSIPNHSFLVKPFFKYTLDSTIRLLQVSNDRVAANLPIYIKMGRKQEIIYPYDIRWVESNRNYCTIQTNQTQYTIKRTLKNIYSHLSNDNFVFIHKSFLVRLSLIKKIDYHSHTVLVGNDILPLGRTYIKILRQNFTQLG